MKNILLSELNRLRTESEASAQTLTDHLTHHRKKTQALAGLLRLFAEQDESFDPLFDAIDPETGEVRTGEADELQQSLFQSDPAARKALRVKQMERRAAAFAERAEAAE